MGLKKSLIPLSAALVLLSQSVVSVSAAEKIVSSDGASGGISGTGTVEGYIEDEIMRVVLPATDLNFILDPNGVIKKTDAVALGGTEYVDFGKKEDGFVFFSKTVNGKKYYSSSTDLEFQNKSSFPVNVKVAASFDSGNSGISLKQSATEFNGASAGIRFSITDGTTAKNAAATATNYIARSLTGMNTEYKYTYRSGAYRFEMAENPDTVYPGFSIKLSGECDGKAAAYWKTVNVASSKLSVVWNISKSDTAKSNAPYVKNMAVSLSSKKLCDVVMDLEFNNRKDVKLSSIIYQKAGTSPVSIPATSYILDGNTLTIKASTFKNLQAGTYAYTLRFSDGSADTVRIEVK